MIAFIKIENMLIFYDAQCVCFFTIFNSGNHMDNMAAVDWCILTPRDGQMTTHTLCFLKFYSSHPGFTFQNDEPTEICRENSPSQPKAGRRNGCFWSDYERGFKCIKGKFLVVSQSVSFGQNVGNVRRSEASSVCGFLHYDYMCFCAKQSLVVRIVTVRL